MNRSLLEDRRVWLGGGLLAGLLLLLAGWTLLIGPKFDSAKSLDSQNDDALAANQMVTVKNQKLAAQAKHLDDLKDDLATALNGLPSDNGLPAFTKELTSTAVSTGVTITSISIQAPIPATVGTTSTSGGSSAGTTSTPAGGAPASTSPAGPVSMGIALNTTGTAAHQLRFLKALQDGDRRILVASSQLSVGGSSSRVNSVSASSTLATQLTIFAAPMTTDQLKAIQADLASK